MLEQFAANNIVEYLYNLDDYEEMETLDYGDPNNNRGVPFMADRCMSVPFAKAANAKEGWVDVYVALGMDIGGGMFAPAIDHEKKEAIIHRVYGNVKILKVEMLTTDKAGYVKKTATA
jgi:hypothetical protein